MKKISSTLERGATMATETATGLDWHDTATAGGDELRACQAHELAGMLADALRITAADGADGYTPAFRAAAAAATVRLTYYLDIARYGETAAVAMEQARDAARDGNFSTAQHLEAIETLISNGGARRGSRLSTLELAQFARGQLRTLVYDGCDLMALVRDAEAAAGMRPAAEAFWQ
jgi:uncharacterized protein YyaL (SSP411 family)